MPAKKTVDGYLKSAKHWKPELERLRDVLRSTKLGEEVKWGMPVYTHNGKNIVGIGGFKSYFGLWFFEGASLTDDAGVLINAQPGKTKAMRQWRMSSARDIKATLIRRYIKEAVSLLP